MNYEKESGFDAIVFKNESAQDLFVLSVKHLV